MKNQNIFTGILCITLFVALSSGISSGQEQDKEKISIAKKTGVGSYLVSSSGKALYFFKNDSANKSACWGACAEKWPVFCYKSDQIAAGEGLKISDFGFFMRSGSDTLEHLTYKGMPLYEFKKDGVPGDTKGHGVNNLWFVVRP